MKVLVATTIGQGDRPGDYCWTVEGELVTPIGPECHDSDRCGCRRGFPGLGSERATTTAMVVEQEISQEELRQALADSLIRQGWIRNSSSTHAAKLIDFHLDAITLAGHTFPTGFVLGRDGDKVVARSWAALGNDP